MNAYQPTPCDYCGTRHIICGGTMCINGHRYSHSFGSGSRTPVADAIFDAAEKTGQVIWKPLFVLLILCGPIGWLTIALIDGLHMGSIPGHGYGSPGIPVYPQMPVGGPVTPSQGFSAVTHPWPSPENF